MAWTIKSTESTNIYYISDRVATTTKVNIKKTFMGNDGFLKTFKWWFDCSQRTKDLLLKKSSI